MKMKLFFVKYMVLAILRGDRKGALRGFRQIRLEIAAVVLLVAVAAFLGGAVGVALV